MKKIIRLTEADLHRIIKKTLNEIGNTYKPIKNNNKQDEDEENDKLTPAQREICFKRHCKNQALMQGRDNLADAFDKYEKNQWEKEYGFDNLNGRPGEAESWHMGDKGPRVSYKDDGSKKLNTIGHRPGLRKKIKQGHRAFEVAPKYNLETRHELFNNGYGAFFSDEEREQDKRRR